MLFDLHCDTLYECYRKGYSLPINPLNIDLTHGQAFSPWCQVFAVWIPDDSQGEDARFFCREILHFARAEAAAHPAMLQLITTPPSLKQACMSHCCAGILAVENGGALGGADVVGELSSLGVRVVTLTWNGENEWGYGCFCKEQHGLKPEGVAALSALESHGIVADVSHLNEAGFWDVAAHATRPFIASHSLSAAVCPHVRNLSDEQFKEIHRRGGLVGLCFCKDHLGEQSLEAIRRHAEHFLSLGGENTVALGGDLDGTAVPDAWKNMAVYTALAEHLAQKGWSDTLLARVFYKNAAKFFDTALHSAQVLI